MFHPRHPLIRPPRLPPAVSHSSVRFVGPWGSAATANLIKLTTIKIRLNYCKAVHWHPRSILKLKKKKRRPSDSGRCSLPAMGSWVKRDKLGLRSPSSPTIWSHSRHLNVMLFVFIALRLLLRPGETETVQYFVVV